MVVHVMCCVSQKKLFYTRKDIRESFIQSLPENALMFSGIVWLNVLLRVHNIICKKNAVSC